MKPRSPLLALLVVCFVFAARLGGADSPAVVDRFGFHEITLLASGRYANPYLECSAEATLTGPDRSASPFPESRRA